MHDLAVVKKDETTKQELICIHEFFVFWEGIVYFTRSVHPCITEIQLQDLGWLQWCTSISIENAERVLDLHELLLSNPHLDPILSEIDHVAVIDRLCHAASGPAKYTVLRSMLNAQISERYSVLFVLCCVANLLLFWNSLQE